MNVFSVHFASDAVDDLRDIRKWLTQERGAAFAESFVAALFSYCEGLSLIPHRGTVRDDLYLGLRLIGWRRRALVAFLVDDAVQTVTVVAVSLRGRDMAAMLSSRTGEKP